MLIRIVKHAVVAVILAALVWSSQSSAQSRLRPNEQPSSAQFLGRSPVTVTDDVGHTFRFESPPRRIISLSPGYTETLFALGDGNRVVGVDDYSDYPAEAALKAKLGGVAHSHNLEQVVSLHPDLVVTLVERGDLMDSLAAQGIPALKLFPNDLQAVLHSILLLGEVTATEERAKEIVERMKTQVNQICNRVKGLRSPRVFLELDGTDPSKPFTSGPHSFIGDSIRIAGGWNIAQNVRTSSSRMSLEAIVAADPEIVILADANNPINPQSKGDIFRRPGWTGITAVRKKAIYPVDNALFFRPGPRIVEGMELLARIFHPEAFE